MSIEFRCPSCQKKLKTGDDKAGKTAKCPQCGTPVTVPAATATAEDDFGGFPSFEEFDAAPGAAPPRRRAPAAAAGQVACPMCGAMNDPAAGRCYACGEDLTARTPSETGKPTASLAFGDVFGTAFDLWKNELGMTVAATLLAIVTSIVAYIVLLALPSLAIDALAQGDNQAGTIAAVVLFIMCLGLFATVAFYLTLGLGRIALDVARRRPVQVGTLFSQAGRLPTMWLNMPLVGIVVVLSAVPGFAVAVGGIALAVQQENAAMALIAIVGYILYVAALSITPQLVWPVSFIAADGHRGLRPFIGTFRLILAKPGLATLLVLFGALLSFAGSLACGVGLLFTIPLTLVMYAVAYDRLRRNYPL
ncbi:MAG TPA: hypothetical protein VF170_10110 [Planctomycetaceae bacterium]